MMMRSHANWPITLEQIDPASTRPRLKSRWEELRDMRLQRACGETRQRLDPKGQGAVPKAIALLFSFGKAAA